MKLVIDIPEKAYNALMHTEFDANLVVDEMRKAIKNGTPLPEHHGRLKDVDWIDENCNHHFSDIDGSWCYTWRDIDKAPTIIEAEGSDAE